MLVIIAVFTWELVAERLISPFLPKVPISKTLISPSKRDCNAGINSLLPCIRRPCEGTLYPFTWKICFKAWVVVLLPLVPVTAITGLSGAKNSRISSME